MKNLLYLLCLIFVGISCTNDDDNQPQSTSATAIYSAYGIDYFYAKSTTKDLSSWNWTKAAITDYDIEVGPHGSGCGVGDPANYPADFEMIYIDFMNYDSTTIESGTYTLSTNGYGKEFALEVNSRVGGGSTTTYSASSGVLQIVVDVANQNFVANGSFVANGQTYTLPTGGISFDYEICP